MMALTDGPLVYIDDDDDDQLLFHRAVRDLGLSNSVHSFTSGLAALQYLEVTTEKPLLILCDLSMPLLDGLELRHYIDQSDYLKQKSIPFIYFAATTSPDQLKQAYLSDIQGFHVKAQVFADLKEQIHLIVTYWQSCPHPSSI